MHKQDKKKKGPVGPEKEEVVDKLETFFCNLHEFHNPVNAPAFVPAVLPPRYAIAFVPATPTSSIASPVIPVFPAPLGSVVTAPSTYYSVIFSVNFVVPSVSSSSCIGPTQ